MNPFNMSEVPKPRLLELLRMQRDLAAWLSVCPDIVTAADDVLSQLTWIEDIDYTALHIDFDLRLMVQETMAIFVERGRKRSLDIKRKFRTRHRTSSAAMRDASDRF